MGIQTKDINAVAAKWAQRAAAAGPDYTAGVKAPRRDWQSNTEAASDSWGAGVNQAVANGSFKRGVAKAGNAKWQANAVAKGGTRYSQGVSVGQPNFASGFGPMLSVIQAVQLPPRQPRGSPGNIQRVSAVNDALHKAKLAGV